jgi:hypothetical protein
MEATIAGLNRTGSKVSPENTQSMTDAAYELTPPMLIDTGASEADRIAYINASDPVGSIPLTGEGAVKGGSRLEGGPPDIFMDKLGERIAFERAGTRLYDALLTKYQALQRSGDAEALPATLSLALQGSDLKLDAMDDEEPLQTLQRIRAEELAHFRMLGDVMEEMGGDATAQTPCADVVGTASLGLIQVLTDPRTTLAQCLGAILTAELTDNAGWEMLVTLADDSGETEMAGLFLGALAQEQMHLAIVKGWLNHLVSHAAGTRNV